VELNPETALQVRTRKRVTRRLIPYLILIYLLAYLDRANLGVAKLHMEAAMGFNDAIIGLGAGVFYLGYLLLNLPAPLLVERWSARKLIAQIMIAFGLAASAMGFLGTPVFAFLHPATQFYALRLLLGIAEAGLFPSIIVYLSHWYRPQDRSRAKGIFMLAQPIALATGIPASGWLLDHIHWAGVASWRWIFILEGLPPLLMGFVSLSYLTDRPQHARWLAPDEKDWLIGQLKADELRKTCAHRVTIMDALRFPQTFLLTGILFLIVSGNQALIFFLPSITNTFAGLPAGLRTAAAGLPYACSAIGIFTNGIWAQRTGKLKWHTVVPVLATGTSVALAVLAHSNAWLETAFFCAAGLTAQAYMPAFWTLPTTLLGKSAAATAVGIICLGNLGGFFGPWLFGYLKTVTGSYQIGLFVLAGCMIAAGLLATRIPSSYALKEVATR
jgi:ACS family tartrate transporter-like MFS transporter